MITDAELRNRMFYHRPTEDQARRHTAVQEASLAYAQEILKHTPSGRAQALAITNLEQAKMWANAAIAHESPDSVAPPVT